MAKSAQRRNLSKSELEKEKLRTEIRALNRSQFRQPAFWTTFFTFLIALITYGWFWQSGLFDTKQAHLTYVTDTLGVYKNRLDANITKLNDSARKLTDSMRTLISQVSSLRTEEASIKAKYAVNKKENLSKKEVIEKTEKLVNNLRGLYLRYKRGDTSYNMVDLMKNSNTLMGDYNALYQAEAIHLRGEMEKYLPKSYQGRLDLTFYTNPTNPFGIEAVTADLEVTLKRIQVSVQ
jgi:hypothetical protein